METMTFEAQERCRMAGRRFQVGDKISVSVDTKEVEQWFQRTCVGKEGPWGPGGFRSRDIECVAIEIADDSGETFYCRYDSNIDWYYVFEAEAGTNNYTVKLLQSPVARNCFYPSYFPPVED